MQKIMLTTFFIITLFTISCEKSGDIKKLLTDEQLTGTWELYRLGGMAPATTYAPNNGNKLVFTGTHYQLYTNGSLEKSGTYTIQQDTTAKAEVCLELPAGSFRRCIVFEPSPNGRKEFFEISGDTLHLLSGCFAYDAGVARTYMRISSDTIDGGGN
jgi:hypothetical protein